MIVREDDVFIPGGAAVSLFENQTHGIAIEQQNWEGSAIIAVTVDQARHLAKGLLHLADAIDVARQRESAIAEVGGAT